jgi:hypothetical protein
MVGFQDFGCVNQRGALARRSHCELLHNAAAKMTHAQTTKNQKFIDADSELTHVSESIASDELVSA